VQLRYRLRLKFRLQIRLLIRQELRFLSLLEFLALHHHRHLYLVKEQLRQVKQFQQELLELRDCLIQIS
jgi:hypothetical protein